jgi:tetratricopeptide (TPR) repeat protein|tara:strand:- start:322 stop:846 length:525 start_codon:yes stop_codon:yes gene_type:complete
VKKILFLLIFPTICFSQSSNNIQNPINVFNSGKKKYDSQDYLGAIKDFSQAIKIMRQTDNSPDYALAYYYRANSKTKLKMYYSALNDYNIVIKRNPNYDLGFHNRGFVKSLLKSHKAAIDDYSRAIKLNPYYTKSYKNRGLSKQYLGISPCKDFKKACELGDSNSCQYFIEDCE